MSLNNLRQKLNEIDDKIINLLVERFHVIEEIGVYKKKNNIDVIQEERINYIILRVREEAIKNNIDPSIFENIFKKIISEACLLEERIVN